MSSSDRDVLSVHAVPWALDELQVSEIFSMSVMHPRESVQEPRIDEHTRRAHQAEEQAHREAECYQQGYRDAERATADADREAVTLRLAALADAIASVQLHAERWTANAEENIAALAVTVARHIVEREVTIDPSIVRDLVQRALTQFPIDQLITVRLHPDDAAYCGSPAVGGAHASVHDMRLVADAHIVRGGCLLEGRERVIDGRVDTSLERAYRSLGQVQG